MYVYAVLIILAADCNLTSEILNVIILIIFENPNDISTYSRSVSDGASYMNETSVG